MHFSGKIERHDQEINEMRFKLTLGSIFNHDILNLEVIITLSAAVWLEPL